MWSQPSSFPLRSHSYLTGFSFSLVSHPFISSWPLQLPASLSLSSSRTFQPFSSHSLVSALYSSCHPLHSVPQIMIGPLQNFPSLHPRSPLNLPSIPSLLWLMKCGKQWKVSFPDECFKRKLPLPFPLSLCLCDQQCWVKIVAPQFLFDVCVATEEINLYCFKPLREDVIYY